MGEPTLFIIYFKKGSIFAFMGKTHFNIWEYMYRYYVIIQAKI